jgi:hypothetical protein
MRSFYLLCVALLAASSAVVGLDTPHVEKLGETTYPRQWDNRVAIPWLDDQNRIRWNDEQVTSAGGCSVEWFPQADFESPRCERRTIMLGPRVDECRCTGKTPAGVRVGIALAGIDTRNRERWRRQSESPQQRDAPGLVGATADGLVFSNWEVWSPLTGDTVRPARSGSRSFYRSAYLPDRDAFLEFFVDRPMIRAKGGLYLRSSPEKRELVLPVDAKLTGYYKVESMAPLPGTSLILLGERFLTRGHGKARFELFDLESRRVLFREERDEDHFIADLRVFAGTGGHALFSWLDESAGKYVVLHYRIR